MKRALTIVLAICFIFLGGSAFAQQLGNPAKLIQKGEFDVGLQGTWVFDQSFEDFDLNRTYRDGTKTTIPIPGSDFEDDGYYMATITYGLTDRLNPFVKIGAVDGGTWLYRTTGSDWKGKLKGCFVWAIGAKGKVFKMHNGLELGVGAQYLRYDNRAVGNWRDLDSGETAEELGYATDDQIDYWQVDVVASLSWNIGMFTPYVGAGYNYSNVSVTSTWTDKASTSSYYDDASFSNENKFTALVGLDADLGMNFTVNLQGTFVSSTALTLGISYRF